MVYHLIMMIIYLIYMINNKNIKRVIYYYYSQHEKEYIDKNFPQDIFISKSVESLWESLGYKKEKKF